MQSSGYYACWFINTSNVMTNNISTILLDAAILLVVGMSVVFVFLTILIFAIHAIEWISNKLPSEQSATPVYSANQAVSASQSTAVTPTDGVSPQVVAAITAAVHQHRNQR